MGIIKTFGELVSSPFRAKTRNKVTIGPGGKIEEDLPSGRYRVSMDSPTFELVSKLKENVFYNRFQQNILTDNVKHGRRYVDVFVDKNKKTAMKLHVKHKADSPDIPDDIKYCTVTGYVRPYANPNVIDPTKIRMYDLDNPELSKAVYPILHPGIHVEFVRLSKEVDFDKHNFDENFGASGLFHESNKTLFYKHPTLGIPMVGRHSIYRIPVNAFGFYSITLPKGKYAIRFYIESMARKTFIYPSPKFTYLPSGSYVLDLMFAINERPNTWWMRRIVGRDRGKKWQAGSSSWTRDAAAEIGLTIQSGDPGGSIVNLFGGAAQAIGSLARSAARGLGALAGAAGGIPRIGGALGGALGRLGAWGAGGPPPGTPPPPLPSSTALGSGIANVLNGIIHGAGKLIEVGSPLIGGVAGVVGNVAGQVTGTVFAGMGEAKNNAQKEAASPPLPNRGHTSGGGGGGGGTS